MCCTEIIVFLFFFFFIGIWRFWQHKSDFLRKAEHLLNEIHDA